MRRNKSSGRKKWIDSDDAPELTKEFFRSANVYKGQRLLRRGRPPIGESPKQAIKLRISPHVLAFYRAGGPGWQTRINTTLERAVSRQSKKARSRVARHDSEAAGIGRKEFKIKDLL